MNTKKWEKEYIDTAYRDNDANDYYYEWVDFQNHKLVGLFQEWLGTNTKDIRVKIKCGKGIILIERIEK